MRIEHLLTEALTAVPELLLQTIIVCDDLGKTMAETCRGRSPGGTISGYLLQSPKAADG